MNHWYLCWLDIWFWVRWIVPALCGWAQIELTKSLLAKERMDDGDYHFFVVALAILGGSYWYAIHSLMGSQ